MRVSKKSCFPNFHLRASKALIQDGMFDDASSRESGLSQLLRTMRSTKRKKSRSGDNKEKKSVEDKEILA